MRITTAFLFAFLLIAGTSGAHAQDGADSSLTQSWTSDNFGYGFRFPDKSIVKYNPLGSVYDKDKGTEKVNFMIRGGRGAITIEFFTERHMVPKGFQIRPDSLYYFSSDSTGTNGRIFRREYIMRDRVVEAQILVTPRGEADILPLVDPIFDSFVAPEGADFSLQDWRFGRSADQVERPRYEREPLKNP